MIRFKALLQETWWLWLALLAFGTLMSIVASKAFLLVYPICFIIFCWFSFVRYDEDGHFKGT